MIDLAGDLASILDGELGEDALYLPRSGGEMAIRVTRRRPDGTPGPEGWYPQAKVSVDEALKAYTVGAAYAAGLESIQGKLAPGYLADLAVIDRDLYAIPGDEILDVNVCGTMVDGGWRYGEWMG